MLKLALPESQEQDNPPRYSLLSLLQMSVNVYHFSDISHLAIPKGGLDLFLNSSDGGAERLCESEKTPGLHCIKHYSSSVTSLLISGFGCVREGDGVI